MKYKDLYNKYVKLLEENEILKTENEKLRKIAGIEEFNENNKIVNNDNKECLTEKYKMGNINNKSLPEDKINLFMSLFRGRKDVYAKRWQGKEGKSGYSPVCINEWIDGICNKKQVKCSECKNRKYAVLDKNAINRHLRGIEVLGIYPMNDDETCYFLAIDFDDEGWENDISIIREICYERKISFAVERSRSGCGAHIWFFFEEKISAVSARKFGTALLTYAMAKRHEIKFKSYDRLFPNQDTMPKGGLGNLIALPLQKRARIKNNSVFIDDKFNPYEDQWSFLCNIGKITKCQIESLTSDFTSDSELGTLIESEDESVKPWEKKKENYKLSSSDFPDTAYITKSNMIYINKSGFSNKALNAIKRMAAFKNPEFYRAQAMRLSTYNKPRVISLSDETKEFLCIPRGCEADILNFLNENKIRIIISDKTNYGQPIKAKFNGKLRDEQMEAANAMLKYDNGVLSATTAFGKTVIGAKLIAEKKVNTLVIVHTEQLLEQWKERLNQFLNIDQTKVIDNTKKRGRKNKFSAIGQIGGGKNKLSRIIDIATIQSLFRKGEVKELVKDYGMVIVDECHHVSAFSVEQVLKSVCAKYVYGLTATPIRKDGHQPIIFMQCGPIRYNVDPLKQAQKSPFKRYVIPRFTPFRKPMNKNEKEWSITDIYRAIAESDIRNQLIVDDVVNCIGEGRNPIVLTERTEHVKVIAEALRRKLLNVITLTGGMSEKDKKEKIQQLEKVNSKEKAVIVATGKFVGEGFDNPRLDTLFLTMPISWKGTLQQYAGRLNRLYKNKTEVQIYDYIDIHVNVLEKMYQKRLKGYASIGYSAKSDSKPIETINSIYNNNDFLDVFINDVLSSKREIIIVSPFVSNRRLSQMLKLLKSAVKNGVIVNIITRPETDFREKSRENIKKMHTAIKLSGINLLLKSKIHQKFAILDEKIVWYGSINLLSFGNSEESIMRLNSINIANELTASCEDELSVVDDK